ncbi:sensor histidine kinase [Armatimonas sp.]|uniref:HAMP domain-containing sensor histidine kinase n=1 Tax=Armatimonas sp. TaxID=1872638 RepID=UPI00286C8829|nr:sensor histidine kinase [Armatimonas sp.]
MLKKLSRLQWQMTLAFLTVSFFSTLALEVLVLAGLTTYFFTSPKVRKAIGVGLSTEVQKHATALEKGDLKEVKKWLAQVHATSEPLPGITVNFTSEDAKTVAAVTDAQGKLIAGFPEGRWRLGEQASFSQPGKAQVRWEGFGLVASIPIKSKSGQRVGHFFYHSGPAEPWEKLWEIFLEAVLPSALVVTICAGLAGGIAGAWVGRRMARRLSLIAGAADAWAEGDFTLHAPESSDELGQLSRRLNRMARDLQDRMALQQDVATLEERNRLARDLHDTVKQQVFATALQVSAARDLLESAPEAARECLDTARELAQQTQKELTSVLKELRPVTPGQGSLPILLQSHIADWSRRTGVHTVLELASPPRLTDDASNALLRLTQEALANIARHSGATEVHLSLRQEEPGVALLSIADNGRGFVPEYVTRRTNIDAGLGLATMRERAEALPGGVFSLQSAPGKGTTITVRCEEKAEKKS